MNITYKEAKKDNLVNNYLIKIKVFKKYIMINPICNFPQNHLKKSPLSLKIIIIITTITPPNMTPPPF